MGRTNPLIYKAKPRWLKIRHELRGSWVLGIDVGAAQPWWRLPEDILLLVSLVGWSLFSSLWLGPSLCGTMLFLALILSLSLGEPPFHLTSNNLLRIFNHKVFSLVHSLWHLQPNAQQRVSRLCFYILHLVQTYYVPKATNYLSYLQCFVLSTILWCFLYFSLKSSGLLNLTCLRKGLQYAISSSFLKSLLLYKHSPSHTWIIIIF